MPGTKTAIVELCLALAEEGQTVVLPDPYYPDYPSGPALAGADIAYVPLDPGNGWPPDFTQAPAENVAAVYLNYPSNPAAVAVPDGAFEEAVAYAQTTGAAIVHDFAYGDLVFDGREPQELPRHPGRQGRRRRAVLDVQVLRHGRLAGRVRRRQRGDRRADQPAQRPLPRRDLPADPGGLHRGADRAAGLRRRAARHLPAPPRPRARGARAVARAAHLRGHLLHLARAARGRHLRDACSPSTASCSRPARGSGRAASAARGSASRSTTRRSSSGSSGSRPRSPSRPPGATPRAPPEPTRSPHPAARRPRAPASSRTPTRCASALEQRQLADQRPGPELGDLLAVDLDVDHAVQDQEQLLPLLALRDQALAGVQLAALELRAVCA